MPSSARTVTRRSPHRQAHRDRVRRRALPRDPPDDRRAAALARHGRKAGLGSKIVLATFDFPDGNALLHRGGHARSAHRSPSCAARRRWRALDPGGVEPLEAPFEAVPRGAGAREPHAQARAHRSAALQRHRQRLLGRDPARGEALAAEAHALAHRRGGAAPARGDARDARCAGPSVLRAEAGERVSRRRSPRSATEMAVHGRFKQPCPVCGSPVQRIVYAENEAQLLRALPDRRQAAGRPVALAAAEGRLAEVHRRRELKPRLDPGGCRAHHRAKRPAGSPASNRPKEEP